MFRLRLKRPYLQIIERAKFRFLTSRPFERGVRRTSIRAEILCKSQGVFLPPALIWWVPCWLAQMIAEMQQSSGHLAVT